MHKTSNSKSDLIFSYFRYSFLYHNDLYYCSTLQLQIHIWSWATGCTYRTMRQSLFCRVYCHKTGTTEGHSPPQKKGDQYWASQWTAVSVHMHCKFVRAFYKQQKERELLKRIIKQYCSCLQGPFPKCERVAQEKAQKWLLAPML